MARRSELLEAVLTVKTLRDALQAFPREEVAEVFQIPDEYLAAFIGETHKPLLLFDCEHADVIAALAKGGHGGRRVATNPTKDSTGAVKEIRWALVNHIKEDVVGYCDTLIDNNKKKWKAIKIGQQSAIRLTTGSHP